jgi:predicted nucleic acid-binding protein
MRIYVLDANAVIRFMTHGQDWERVKALLEKASTGEAQLLISVVNWGEVIYIMAKRIGLAKTIADLKTLGTIMAAISVEEDLAEEAAALKHNFKLGYADSFAAALTINRNATLVTADPDFEKLGKRIKIMALARSLA